MAPIRTDNDERAHRALAVAGRGRGVAVVAIGLGALAAWALLSADPASPSTGRERSRHAPRCSTCRQQGPPPGTSAGLCSQSRARSSSADGGRPATVTRNGEPADAGQRLHDGDVVVSRNGADMTESRVDEPGGAPDRDRDEGVGPVVRLRQARSTGCRRGHQGQDLRRRGDPQRRRDRRPRWSWCAVRPRRATSSSR